MKQFPIITEITPEVLHGAMDQLAMNIGIAFGAYLNDNKYYPHATIKGLWCQSYHEITFNTPELYDQFINELLCKSVNKDASAS